MLRCVDPAGNNGQNVLSTEMVSNRFIIGEEKACNTVRVQVNILLPPPLRYLHAPRPLTLTNFESWTQTGPAFQGQKLEYKVETAL